jgi:hypothetical protein
MFAAASAPPSARPRPTGSRPRSRSARGFRAARNSDHDIVSKVACKLTTTNPDDHDRPVHNPSQPIVRTRAAPGPGAVTRSCTAVNIGHTDKAAVRITLWCSLHCVHVPSTAATRPNNALAC